MGVYVRGVLTVVCCTAVLLAPPASAGGSAATGQSASDFAVEVSWGNVRSQYGKVWSRLHPRHQRVTTRAFWEACQRKRAKERGGIEVHGLKAIDEYADIVKLPLLGPRRVQAVTLEMRYSHPLLGSNKKLTDTVYVIRWGETWKGLWTPESYQAYAKRRCPA
jgi:hypothetical protein